MTHVDWTTCAASLFLYRLACNPELFSIWTACVLLQAKPNLISHSWRAMQHAGRVRIR